MIEVTQEMIDVFGEAWEAEDDRQPLEKGARRRAGLTAVFALLAQRGMSGSHPHDGIRLDCPLCFPPEVTA